MLKLTNLQKVFNAGTASEVHALNGLNLTLADGEFLTIVGGNGSGKSTLMNIIAGVHTADRGQIEIDGKNITPLCAYKRARYIGRVFQDPMMGTVSNMSIEENLALASKRGHARTLARGLKKTKRRNYAALLKRLDLGLEDRMKTMAGLLSGGQRQAMTLLMAVMQQPRVLMLDEHTAALDPKTAQKVLSLSEELIREHTLTTIMVTHNMKDAIRYGDRLIMMQHGDILFACSGEAKRKLTAAELSNRFASTAAAQ